MRCIQEELRALADSACREFQCRLMPTVDPGLVLGVRAPALRTYAKRLMGDARVAEFLHEGFHGLYEEKNLHGELINLAFSCKGALRACTLWPEFVEGPGRGGIDWALAAIDDFLPQVDNWATCDLLSPKVLGRHPERVLNHICTVWLTSEHAYTVRFGVVTLMRHYLDGEFAPEQLGWVADLPAGEYYIDMARAWYFSFALIEQYDATIGLFERPELDIWTHNKALQKARESRRVDASTKDYLQSLKIKK